MDQQEKKRRLLWLRNIPPVISLMLVVAFGILFAKLVQEINLPDFQFSKILSVLNPFIIGLVITFFLLPLVKVIEKLLLRSQYMKQHTKITNTISVVSAYLLVFGLIVLFLVYIVPQVISGLSTLISLLIQAIQSIYNNLDTIIVRWDSSSWSSMISGQKVYSFLSEQLSSLTIDLQNIAATVLPMLYKTVANIASGSINFFVGIIISLYLVSDRHHAAAGGKRLLYALLKDNWADQTIRISKEILGIFRRFFIGQALDSLLIGIVCYILMKIFGLPYAELISVIVGVTNVIPFFGPFIGAIPSGLIILMVSPMDALIFAVMILILQQLDGNILNPAILGNSLGLKPIWIVLSVTIGGGLFGAIGMVIGVPVFTVIYTLTQRGINRLIVKKASRNQPAAPSETDETAPIPSEE